MVQLLLALLAASIAIGQSLPSRITNALSARRMESSDARFTRGYTCFTLDVDVSPLG